MDQHADSPGHSTYTVLLCRICCILYQLPPLLLANFWILWCRKRIDAVTPTIRLDATPSGLSAPPLPSSDIFTWTVLCAATLPVYPGLGLAPNNAGLQAQWLTLLCLSVPWKSTAGWSENASVHARTHTDGRTTQKHNVSIHICRMGKV